MPTAKVLKTKKDNYVVFLLKSIVEKTGFREGDELEVFHTPGTLTLVDKKALQKTFDKQLPAKDPLEKGYAVAEKEAEAKQLSNKLRDEIKNASVLGVRGFDKKFYIIKKNLFEESREKIAKSLGNGAKRVQELSQETGLEENLVKCVLEFLKDQGEVVEKTKQNYQLIG